MAAGGVDGKSLGDLDRGLAKKLEFRCKGGKGTPPRGSSKDRRQGVLDESTPRYGWERSVAWHRETSRKRSPSRSCEDLGRRLEDSGRDRRWPIAGGCRSCGALGPHAFQACPAKDAVCRRHEGSLYDVLL